MNTNDDFEDFRKEGLFVIFKEIQGSPLHLEKTMTSVL